MVLLAALTLSAEWRTALELDEETAFVGGGMGSIMLRSTLLLRCSSACIRKDRSGGKESTALKRGRQSKCHGNSKGNCR
jgi:hypothetical protein